VGLTMHPLAAKLQLGELVVRSGRVTAVRGQTIEANGPLASLGELCRIELPAGAPALEAEVLGFRAGLTVLMASGRMEGAYPGARIVATGRHPGIRVGRGLLGRVIDADGEPIDDRGPIGDAVFRDLRARPVSAMRRARVREPLETGVRVIDAMLSLARGQRIGLFAGSGVGKSALLGAIARGTQADINVIALVGERSREVREFAEDQLGAEGLQRSVVVVATSAESAVMRLRAAHAATTVAEYFRDAGQDVLLMMDSLTRFAMARREVGLAAGEPPTARGYTPSVFSELPQLCERSGPGHSGGSITGIYTVLVDGDDMNEPVADTVRGTLDGHIVLSREIANRGRYPAVDVLRSVSRLHPVVAPRHALAAARELLACCALYERNRQLIEVGAYKPGVNAALDDAVRMQPQIERYFGQAQGDRCSRSEALDQLVRLAGSMRGTDGPH